MKSKSAVCGYSLVESMVAISILLLGVAAAASLATTICHQENINISVDRALGQLENASRLYFLGLNSAEIVDILPPFPEKIEWTFNDVSKTFTHVGSLNFKSISLSFSADPSGNLTSSDYTRTHTVVVYR